MPYSQKYTPVHCFFCNFIGEHKHNKSFYFLQACRYRPRNEAERCICPNMDVDYYEWKCSGRKSLNDSCKRDNPYSRHSTSEHCRYNCFDVVLMSHSNVMCWLGQGCSCSLTLYLPSRFLKVIFNDFV